MLCYIFLQYQRKEMWGNCDCGMLFVIFYCKSRKHMWELRKYIGKGRWYLYSHKSILIRSHDGWNIHSNSSSHMTKNYYINAIDLYEVVSCLFLLDLKFGAMILFQLYVFIGANQSFSFYLSTVEDLEALLCSYGIKSRLQFWNLMVIMIQSL